MYYRELPFNLNNISKFPLCKQPNVSIIIPTYNSKNELFSIQKSIQDQSLKNIEIIYIDNDSTDNTTKIIKEFQQKDKRIILLENKGNKGPFYSRNKGALFARGEYIQFLDSDDLLFGNTLERGFLTAKVKNADIVQYKVLIKFKTKYFILNELSKEDIIYQPELSNLMYYGKGTLSQTLFYIFNKIIKRETFLKALIFMGNDILKENLNFNENLYQFFCVLRVADSMLFIKNYGYAKLSRINKNQTLLEVGESPKNANKILHDHFIIVKSLYYKTIETKRDKAICL